MGLLPDDSMIAVAAGAKSHTKRWMREEFIKVCGRLTMEENFKVILVGDDNDKGINREIATSGVKEVYDVTGRTTLRELAYLLSLCKLIITNDSAPLHIASAVGIASVAIFGPTDPKKYGPIYPNSIVVRTDIKCSPCEKALCRFEWDCMKGISADEVFNAAKSVLLK
jgi:ADP-heptose:LPS heptosyltransferase